MATGKKSFVLYTDLVHSVEILNDEQAGKLFKHILNYVNDFDPKETDPFVRLAFEPIKQQLKRDLKVWKTKKKKRSDAGKKGMESRWHSEITKDNNVIKPITKITVNDNVTVNGNVNDTVIKRERAFAPPSHEEVVNLFLEKLDEFTAMAEAGKFINFYESKNWYVGKNKMKKWSAAAAGWISRMNDFKKQNNGSNPNSTSTNEGTSAQRIRAARNW